MTIIEEFELAQTSLRSAVELLAQVVAVHPTVEDQLRAIAASEDLTPDMRALLKVLMAVGTFALAQLRTEAILNDLAAACEKRAGALPN